MKHNHHFHHCFQFLLLCSFVQSSLTPIERQIQLHLSSFPPGKIVLPSLLFPNTNRQVKASSTTTVHDETAHLKKCYTKKENSRVPMATQHGNIHGNCQAFCLNSLYCTSIYIKKILPHSAGSMSITIRQNYRGQMGLIVIFTQKQKIRCNHFWTLAK